MRGRQQISRPPLDIIIKQNLYLLQSAKDEEDESSDEEWDEQEKAKCMSAWMHLLSPSNRKSISPEGKRIFSLNFPVGMVWKLLWSL